MARLGATAALPFTPGLTLCDMSIAGDGVCDTGNNDMTCGFDGGDCCRLTNSELNTHDSCRSPDGVSRFSEWVVSAADYTWNDAISHTDDRGGDDQGYGYDYASGECVCLQSWDGDQACPGEYLSGCQNCDGDPNGPWCAVANPGELGGGSDQ